MIRFEKKLLSVVALPMTLVIAPPATAAQTPHWSLVGREGTCMPLSVLARRGPELRDVQSPYHLLEIMRAAGHKAEIKEHKAGSPPAVEVRVPSQNLYVMFVTTDRCPKESSPTETGPSKKGP